MIKKGGERESRHPLFCRCQTMKEEFRQIFKWKLNSVFWSQQNVIIQNNKNTIKGINGKQKVCILFQVIAL